MRRFPSFLKAYSAFYEEQAPAQFTLWVCLSIIAGALERRCWLPWTDTYSFYPNIYVLLTGKSGCRKSTAIKYGTGMLDAVRRKTGNISMLSDQVTQPKFVEEIGKGRSFTHRWTEEKTDAQTGLVQLVPREMTVLQNSMYYSASEASSSLRDIFGEFIACLVDLYDCPATWERSTKKDVKPVRLQNVCVNLLAGSTFDYLGELINDKNIQGGFASRNIYVVHRSKVVKPERFAAGLSEADRAVRREYYAALLEDLISISKMTGPMHATPEFAAAWEAWYQPFHEQLNALESESLQSILARTNTNTLKVSMLLSAAESDDRELRLSHWEQAVRLMEEINAEVPVIFQEARAKQGPNVKGALSSLVMTMVKGGGVTKDDIMRAAVIKGHNAKNAEEIFNALKEDGAVRVSAVVGGRGASLEPGRNSDKYL